MGPALQTRQFGALNRLRLISRRHSVSPLPGRRPGPGAGQSVDFADYRRYCLGDEVRYIDWNLYARLGKLYSRQFRAESDLKVHILLDGSGSMGFGDAEKLECASQIARALSYMALRQLDHVGLATFSQSLRDLLPARRAGGQLLQVLEVLERLKAEGETDFERTIREFIAATRGAGLAIVISDFTSPRGFREGLELLLHKRYEIVLVQVLAEEELSPNLDGDYFLSDLENPTTPKLEVGPDSAATYLANLRRSLDALETFCRRNRVRWMRTTSSADVSRWTLELLHRGVCERV